MKKEIKKGHKCRFCGKIRITKIDFVPDPYSLEINEDESEFWICHQCQRERADEI